MVERPSLPVSVQHNYNRGRDEFSSLLRKPFSHSEIRMCFVSSKRW